jgi:hypothetical protein
MALDGAPGVDVAIVGGEPVGTIPKTGKEAVMKANELGALWSADRSTEGLARRVDLLTELVFDLAVEVEGLRAERVAHAAKTGDTAYADAYAEASGVAHNGAGVVPGWMKLLARFYGWRDEDAAFDGGSLRELVLLRRLGLGDDQLREFVEHIRHLQELS